MTRSLSSCAATAGKNSSLGSIVHVPTTARTAAVTGASVHVCLCAVLRITTQFSRQLWRKKDHQPPHLMTVQVVWTKHGSTCKRGPRSGEFHIFTTLCNIASSSIANIHSFSATVSLHQQVHYRHMRRYQRQGG